MSTTFIASNTAYSSGATSVTVTKPTGTAEGDLMFFQISRPLLDTDPSSVPSGWNLIAQNRLYTAGQYWIYYKLAGASEPANYAFSWAVSSKVSGDITTYRGGFDADDPIGPVSNTVYTTSDKTIRAASITTILPASPILFFGSLYRTSEACSFTAPTVPGTFTENLDYGDTGSDVYQCVYSLNWTQIGATGTMDGVIVTSTGAVGKHAFAIALNPPLVDSGGTTYKALIGSGGCRMAYVWNVAGYPWAVCSDKAVVSLLANPGSNSDAAYARKRIFGKMDIDGVFPAYQALVFPTLHPELGVQTTKCKSVGFSDVSSWKLKIIDQHLGADWPHVEDGDSVWGLEGLHRVADLKDEIHGWGFLSDNLSTTDSDVSISEESDVLFNRINNATSPKWMWIGHECIAVQGVTGTYPDYSAIIFGRGLFRSKTQYHFVDAIEQVHQIIADVPGSIAGHYCWLWAIPLTEDGGWYYGSDGNPIIAMESARCGVVSESLVTTKGVTQITVNPCLDALKNKITYDVTESVAGHIGKYIFCRGQSGTDWQDIGALGQKPHLIISEYEIDWNSTIGQGAYGDDIVFGRWTTKPVWLCAKGDTVSFDTLQDLVVAVNDELKKLHDYHSSSGTLGTDQFTGDGTSGNAYIGLAHSYQITKNYDFFDTIPIVSFENSLGHERQGTLSTNGMWYMKQTTGGGNYCLFHDPSALPGTLVVDLWTLFGKWSMVGGIVQVVLGLGIPHLVEIHKEPIEYRKDDNHKLDCFSASEITTWYEYTWHDFTLNIITGQSFTPAQFMGALYQPFGKQETHFQFHQFGVPAGLCQRAEIMEFVHPEDVFCAKYFRQWDWINFPIATYIPNWEDTVLDNTIPDSADTNGVLHMVQDPDYAACSLWVDETNIQQFAEGATVRIGQYKAVVEQWNSGEDTYLTTTETDERELNSENSNGVAVGSCLICIPAWSTGNMSTDPTEINTQYVHDLHDPNALKLYRSDCAGSVVEICQSFMGYSGTDIMLPFHERRYYIPFFRDDTTDDTTSIIDWDSLEEMLSSPVQGSSTSVPYESFILLDALDAELKFYGLGMYEDWDNEHCQMVYRFRPFGNFIASAALNLGRVITKNDLPVDSVDEDHLDMPLFNRVTVDYYPQLSISAIAATPTGNQTSTIGVPGSMEGKNTITATVEDVFSVVHRQILELKISLIFTHLPSVSEGNTPINDHMKRLIAVLNERKPTQKRDVIYSARFRTLPGRECIITDPAAHYPGTHQEGLIAANIMITEQKVDLSRNVISLCYLVSGDNAQHGYAPSVRFAIGSVSLNADGFTVTPEDHYSSFANEPKDIYYFDCYDVSDLNNPVPRTCSCGNYAVMIYKCDEVIGADNPLPATCTIVTESGVDRIRFYCDESKLPATGNMVVTFASFDDCEDCQKLWMFFSDEYSTVGTVARRGDVWR